ncbi:MAG: hypothetical protein H6741_33275 [Alphaproteobacteria bacterium]|nr:hypothetical protein [Alphaproteobacteria bacterium]
MASTKRNRTARYRAKLKSKKRKERLRKAGLMKVRKAGGRMKPTGEAKRAHGIR